MRVRQIEGRSGLSRFIERKGTALGQQRIGLQDATRVFKLTWDQLNPSARGEFENALGHTLEQLAYELDELTPKCKLTLARQTVCSFVLTKHLCLVTGNKVLSESAKHWEEWTLSRLVEKFEIGHGHLLRLLGTQPDLRTPLSVVRTRHLH